MPLIARALLGAGPGSSESSASRASSSGSVRGLVCHQANPKTTAKNAAPPPANVSRVGFPSAGSSLSTVTSTVAPTQSAIPTSENAAQPRLDERDIRGAGRA